jgi:hypothetical protein
MNDVMISSLKTYWERLRAGRIAPYRAEIDPREFENALENMLIVERIAPGNLRIRLAGMKVCEMMGMEIRGMQPDMFVVEGDRARFDRLLGVVMSEPAVVEIEMEVAGPKSLRQRATMLLMPLRSDFGEINRVLGCLSLEAGFFQAPLTFTLKDIAINPVQAARADAAKAALPGFAEDAAPFAGPVGAPKLRAIEGNPDAAPIRRNRPKLRLVDRD